jgi:hypothetical protein
MHHVCRQAGRTAGREAGRQDGRQEGRTPERQTGRRIDVKKARCTNKDTVILVHTVRQLLRLTARQVGRQAGREAGGQKGRQESRQAGRKAGGQKGRQTEIQTYRNTDRQTYTESRQTGRHTDSAEMQEGSQTNRQMYGKTNVLTCITYIQYRQACRHTRLTDTDRQAYRQIGRKTDQQTERRQSMCAVKKNQVEM